MTSFGDLPAGVRRVLLSWAAATLGELADPAVPSSLRKVRSFTPLRRASAGAGALARALSEDKAFRTEVVARAPADGEPAAVAWLRSDADALAVALADLAGIDVTASLERELAEALSLLARVERDLAGALERLAAQSDEVERLRAEAAARTEELRRRMKPLQQSLSAVERERDEARAAHDRALVEGAEAVNQRQRLQGELDRVKVEMGRLASDLAAARASSGSQRSALDRRTTLLLDTLIGAASGLQRELAPAGDGPLPGDLVEHGVRADARAAGRGDLDSLLQLPRVHVLVDGYNVTKGTYGSLSLEEQRSRLMSGVAALVARTGAEVTVVFDGQGRIAPGLVTPRGVRVVFTEPGQLADDVLIAYVGAEPPGRAVVVVSSDREVATGARARGAWSVPSAELAARLW